MAYANKNKQREAQRKYDSKRSKRHLSWAAILYPESCVSNWRDILDDLHIEWAESPLHDKDVNPTGELKKPHIHLAFTFPAVQTYEEVAKITESIGATIPQPLKNLRGMIRYFIHLDNPEKYQYNRTDIKVHGGMDISNCFLNSSDRTIMIREMIAFVRENNIMYFSDLFDYADQNNPDWFDSLCNNSSYCLKEYIKSRAFMIREQMTRK